MQCQLCFKYGRYKFNSQYQTSSFPHSSIPNSWYCSTAHWPPQSNNPYQNTQPTQPQAMITNIAPTSQTWFPYSGVSFGVTNSIRNIYKTLLLLKDLMGMGKLFLYIHLVLLLSLHL